MEAHEALLNVTWQGQNGELAEPVPWDAADGDVKQMAAESIRAGNIAGIDADAAVNLQDFVVRRFDAKDDLPNRLVIRPKTPFGG
jgi:hypothetical protein